MRQKLFLFVSILSLTFAAASGALSQWVQTNGPFGGEVSCFATMGTNIFTGGYDCGVFRSTDNGKSWKATGSHFSYETAITAIGTNIIAASDDGVFYSMDSGTNWRASAGIYSGGGFTEVTGMVAIGRCLFAATLSEGSMCATYLSRDSGKTWADTGQAPADIQTLVVTDGKIFAGTDGGCFLSMDTGLTWTAKSNGLTLTFITGLAVSDTNLFAIADNGSWTDFKVFLSTDDGTIWTVTDTNLPLVSSRAITTSETNLYVGSDSGVYLSSNNGYSWTSLGLTDLSISSVCVVGSNLLAGTQNGVYHSSNAGKSWSLVGLTCTDIYSMATQGSNLVAGSSFGLQAANVFLSTNDGVNWFKTSYDSYSMGDPVWAVAADASTIYAASDDYGLLRSNDGGTNWTSIGRNSGCYCINSIYSFLIDGTKLIVGGDGDDIFLSTDNGTNMSLRDSALTNNALNNNVYALARIGTTITAGTSNAGIFLSTDDGGTWGIPNNGFPDSTVLALAVSGQNVFAATYPDGVFLSADNGSNWTLANTGLKNAYVYSFAVSGKNIFAGTDSGIFLSTNTGASWMSVSSGLPANFIHDLVINDSNLYVGTDSAGVWRRPLSEMINTSAVEPTALGIQPSISAYPNPFPQSSTITFSCAEAGVGEVSIINLLGTEIARVFSGELGAGEHSFSWDASGAAAGIYECVVRVNGNVQRIALAHLSEP